MIHFPIRSDLQTRHPGLKPSPLRPDCPAAERIRHWKPENARNVLDDTGRPTNLDDDDLSRIQQVLEEAYAPSTKSTYGTGLLAFHVFCDAKDIDEKHRAPIDQTVLASFISALAGVYAGGSIKNFVYGIRAWHTIHGAAWVIEETQLQALLVAGSKMTPSRSKKAGKQPWTVAYLAKICQGLNLKDAKDAAIHACLTTAFWGTARLGEVTVPKLEAFNPRTHIKVSDVQYNVKDRNDLEETVLFLPWTKAAKEKGEKIFWAKQNGIVDPQWALANHIEINNPPPKSHLFSFKHPIDGMRPMTRTILITRIGKIADANGLDRLPGHGLRVGSTLEYLLRGVPFDVVKAKGRWQSEAFKGYLRKHAQIMAPYMQAEPKTYDNLIRYTMPPVR
jgi:hypothetical protein